MLAVATDDEALELGESELIIGKEVAEGSDAIVDLSSLDEEDSFEALAQAAEETGPDEEDLKLVEGEEV